jgi:hypothetical protein
VAIDAQFADLSLGYTDAIVMAIAERDGLPILTFDFQHVGQRTPPADIGSSSSTSVVISSTLADSQGTS